jgi:nitrogen-specific signal transduction histidine kinase
VQSRHHNVSLASKNDSLARNALDLIPCAVVIWNKDRSVSVLNQAAHELLGFEAPDLQHDPSLWINRIHSQDRDLFRAAWKKLLAGERRTSCDYRFSPAHGEKDIWIRDVSVSHQSSSGEVDSVTSAYMNVSDLRSYRPRSQEERRLANASEIIDSMVHGIKNDLQIINSGLDLMWLTGNRLSECQPLFEGVERINRSIHELREFFAPAEPQLSGANPKVILEEFVREIGRKLSRQKIHLRVRCRGPMPLVRLDWNKFRRVLGQVIEFSRLLLPQGGNLEIKSELQELAGKKQVELQISCASATSLAVDEDDVFRPFLKINGCQAGFGIALARQILCLQNGDISFQKQNSKRGLFTISLEAH